MVAIRLTALNRDQVIVDLTEELCLLRSRRDAKTYKSTAQSEIGKVIGVSQMQISRLLRRTLDELAPVA